MPIRFLSLRTEILVPADASLSAAVRWCCPSSTAMVFSAAPHMTPELIHAALRVTGRISLLLFLTAYVASSLRVAWPSPASRWLLENRRWVGLSFALSHTIHLAFIALLFSATNEQRDLVTVIVGGMGYVFLYAMAATSNDRAVAWLGAKRWKRLHSIGLHYLWFVFTATSLPDAPKNPWAAASATLLIGALLFRIAVRRGALAPARA